MEHLLLTSNCYGDLDIFVSGIEVREAQKSLSIALFLFVIFVPFVALDLVGRKTSYAPGKVLSARGSSRLFAG